MAAAAFQLPIAFDLAATLLFAITGAIAGLKKRYDLVGIMVLALVTGLGGALLRDGLFLQGGPPAVLDDARYLVAVLAGGAAGIAFGRRLHRLRLVFAMADALGLGMYAVVGAQKSLAAGLPLIAATVVGTVNAVGGSMLRDVLVREEPLLFKPGEFYALAALAGAVVFVALAAPGLAPAPLAGLAAIAVAFATRILSLALGWRTGALAGEEPWEGTDRRG